MSEISVFPSLVDSYRSIMLKVKKFGGKTFQKYRDEDEDLYDDDFEDFDYGNGLHNDVRWVINVNLNLLTSISCRMSSLHRRPV